ncbi:MAG TPA: KH domain-containing protein [Methanothermobacter sp.]|nr:transcription elongation factor NusA-like protein [Methanothermobacter sp. MT-2]HHW04646.1 transcription elongation factor NusA [Methanothermobacter sp.]HOK72111.1 KH domain-containing protein [Methanothermobacter sp.]HOL68424.1 KH domain-containing protein [Methanothermobacter sp.]HPQ04182.1 KH domain-containing protein [Methanothermobacter sp.]
MGLPICDVCLKSGILCQGCEDKLKSGEVSELELEISKVLYKLAEGKLWFKKAIDMGDVVIIITERDQVGKLIGKGGKIVRTISRAIGKRVRVVGEDSDLKSVAEDVLAPARISGINIVYGKDGKEKFKIRVIKEDARRIPISLDVLNRVIKQLTGEETTIVVDEH